MQAHLPVPWYLKQEAPCPTLLRSQGKESALSIHVCRDLNRGPSTTLHLQVQNLFALVIGIDDYPDPYRLFGAAADAKAMEAYLKDDLRVLPDHICFLVDQQATRDEIIKAFDDFKNNRHIKNGDPIVIFFAGHGRELTAPLAWGGNKIQSILPYDYGTAGPIPDRTIGALIDNIAKEKGDNITVILDCCYSAGCARQADQGYVSRTLEFDFPISADFDQNIWGSRCSSLSNGFAHQGHRSHVLLAACGVNEFAYERAGRGLFTSALLTVLKSGAAHDRSYTQILGDIVIDKQNPQCLGTNRHRILFDHGMPHGGLVRYSAQVDEHGILIIGAGLAHGVSHGVEFSLHDNHKLSLGVAVVNDSAVIDDFRTTITAFEALALLANASYAKLTRVGRVPLYLAPATGSLYPILKKTLHGMVSNAPNVEVVEEIKDAKLQVAMRGNLVVFDTLDRLINRLGLMELPYTIPLDRLAHVLRAAARYYGYLDLTNTNRRSEPAVTVDLHLLKESPDYDDYGLSTLVPVGSGLCQADASSPDNPHVINLVVSPEDCYGIRVTNNTPRDLYMNAFLFNNSSLSITPCYTQPSGGNPEPPLKQNGGMFAIGEGTGETTPLSFTLRHGQDIDVGYLKVFFATRPIDLSDIAQVSPFPEKSQLPIKNSDGARDGDLAEGSPTRKVLSDIWFTVTIPVVQRR